LQLMVLLPELLHRQSHLLPSKQINLDGFLHDGLGSGEEFAAVLSKRKVRVWVRVRVRVRGGVQWGWANVGAWRAEIPWWDQNETYSLSSPAR
jgi:hypothetical protein